MIMLWVGNKINSRFPGGGLSLFSLACITDIQMHVV